MAMTTIANRLVRHDPLARPENLRLFGPSGTGKSTLLKTYRDAYPPFVGEDRTIIPVLYVIVPPVPSMKSMLTAFLDGLGVRNPASGTAIQQTQRVLTLTKECRVELILVDEGQHLIDRGRERTQTTVADALKVVFDSVEIPAVLAGAPRMERLFTINSQLRRRFAGSYTLRPFNCEDLFAPFRGFIHSISADFQKQNRAWLASPEVARLLFFASDGIAGNVVDILRFVAGADAAGRSLALIDLSTAFRHAVWEFPAQSADPFGRSFRMTRLTQPGEPFEPSLLDGDNHVV
jgi:Bacterial TniB protein